MLRYVVCACSVAFRGPTDCFYSRMPVSSYGVRKLASNRGVSAPTNSHDFILSLITMRFIGRDEYPAYPGCLHAACDTYARSPMFVDTRRAPARTGAHRRV